jgi:anti-sigma regulatory factor (Ser/Thr protein kinase)
MAEQGVRRNDALTGAITLPGEQRAVANGRRFVRQMLGRRHPALDKVALGVSELVTNAVEHTESGDGGEIRISLTVAGDLIRAEVTNDGVMTSKPHVRNDTEGEDGRGILIVEALAEAWGVTENARTTTVWAEFWAGAWPPPGADMPGGTAPAGG